MSIRTKFSLTYPQSLGKRVYLRSPEMADPSPRPIECDDIDWTLAFNKLRKKVDKVRDVDYPYQT